MPRFYSDILHFADGFVHKIFALSKSGSGGKIILVIYSEIEVITLPGGKT